MCQKGSVVVSKFLDFEVRAILLNISMHSVRVIRIVLVYG